jgi:molybdate transport system regulatory protein
MRRAAELVRPRFRVYRGEDIALGPGKADLLEGIDRSGSITAAAQALEMSYLRAWKLVQTMNACFRTPLVECERGGSARGGARLTERGRAVLDAYREMERLAARAIARQASALAKHLA